VSNTCETTHFIYMPMILTMLVVMIWNILKRISFFGGLSKLLLTASLSLLCLLWIGEFVAASSAQASCQEHVGSDGIAQTIAPPVKINPYTDVIPSLIAAFVFLFLIGMVVFADDIHCETIETLLGLSPKPPKANQSMKSEFVLKRENTVVDEAK
jgi:hypothetical protein